MGVELVASSRIMNTCALFGQAAGTWRTWHEMPEYLPAAGTMGPDRTHFGLELTDKAFTVFPGVGGKRVVMAIKSESPTRLTAVMQSSMLSPEYQWV